MKKLTFSAVLLFSVIAFLSGCAGTQPDFKVMGSRGVNLVISVNHSGSNYYSSYYLLQIKQDKEEFFEYLQKNKFFKEKFDDDTLVFYKTFQGESAYFAVIYDGFANGLHRYQCRSAEAGIEGQYGQIDFPFYAIMPAQSNGTLREQNNMRCDFDYIVSFYEGIPEVVREQGEDYIIVKSSFPEYDVYPMSFSDSAEKLWQEVKENDVRIEDMGNRTVKVTVLTEE